MPMTWTPDADRRLLLLVLEISKVNNAQIAERWAEKHGPEGGEQPTARAITERLFKLKKLANDGRSAGTPKGPAAPRTPGATPAKAKKAEPKTPASSSKKRGKGPAMSDEDEDSGPDESDVPEESPAKRVRLQRRSKTPKKYQEPSSEDEDEAEPETEAAMTAESEVKASSSKFNASSSEMNGHASVDVFNETDGAIERNHGVEMDNLSDISDFKPAAESV